jgi:hypothetical protein
LLLEILWSLSVFFEISDDLAALATCLLQNLRDGSGLWRGQLSRGFSLSYDRFIFLDDSSAFRQPPISTSVMDSPTVVLVRGHKT